MLEFLISNIAFIIGGIAARADIIIGMPSFMNLTTLFQRDFRVGLGLGGLTYLTLKTVEDLPDKIFITLGLITGFIINQRPFKLCVFELCLGV